MNSNCRGTFSNAIPLRLLIACEFSTLLGGERSMLTMLPALRAAGAEVAVAAPASGALAEAVRAAGATLLPFDVRNAAGKRRELAEIHTAFSTLVHEFRPTIIHANSLSMGRHLGDIIASLGVPSVCHLRDIMKISKNAAKQLNAFDCLLAVSRATKDYHIAQGIEAARTLVLHNGIDSEIFCPRDKSHEIHRELSIPSGCSLILSVGQIGLRKGVQRFLEVAKHVAKQDRNVHFLLVGTRTSDKEESVRYEAMLHAMAKEYPLDGRVHFLGTRNDVARLMNDARLLLHTAKQEPLGRVLLEAATTGLPIVATRVGGTAEIFPDICNAAMLVEANHDTPEEQVVSNLAAATLSVLNSPALAKTLSNNARRRMLAIFSKQTAAKKLLRVYQSIV